MHQENYKTQIKFSHPGQNHFPIFARNLLDVMHIKSIYDEGELIEVATCKEYLQVREEGSKQVKRKLKHYNLDLEPNFNF